MTEQPEVIRVDPDGTEVLADWDDSDKLAATLSSIENGAPEATSRADSEAQHWAAGYAERIRVRLSELNVAREQAEALMNMPDSSLLAGIERWYSAPEAAKFFGKSPQWIYERMGNKKFRYKDGSEIIPHYDGPPDAKRPRMRFNLALIREMAFSCYRSGTVKMNELTIILRRVAQAEVGEAIFEVGVDE